MPVPVNDTRYAVLGRIGAPHGIKGWLHVHSHTEPPQALLDHRHWTLRDARGQRRDCELIESQYDGRNLRARLAGIADRDAAAALTGAEVEIERQELPATAAREYYRDDLIGFAVRNRDGVALGTLSHFVDAPAQPVMVVKGEREHWIAAAPPHLHRVDLAARLIEVDWPAEL